MPLPVIKRGALGVVAAAAVLLAGACGEKQVESPTLRGACWHMVAKGEEPPKFNRLPGAYPSMEFCAAALETVRITGGRQQVIGGYQGRFIFASARGIYVGKTLKGARYMALVRTGDGRLSVPGAVR